MRKWRERENDERIRKWRIWGERERERKWQENQKMEKRKMENDKMKREKMRKWRENFFCTRTEGARAVLGVNDKPLTEILLERNPT